MDRYEEMLDTIIDSVGIMINNYLKNASFDKTRTGKIVNQIDNRTYTVSIDNVNHIIKSLSDSNYPVNSIVKVVVPEGQYNNMYIQPSCNGGVVTSFWTGTQAEYDAITNKSLTTLYLIQK